MTEIFSRHRGHLFIHFVYRLIDWLIDDCSIDCLLDWLVDWLIDWLIDWFSIAYHFRLSSAPRRSQRTPATLPLSLSRKLATFSSWTLPNPKTKTWPNFLSSFSAALPALPTASLPPLAALSHAVFEFKDKLSKPMLDMLMENMNVLLASNVRDIVSSVFGFLKVLFSRLVGFELGPHVPRLVASISSMEDNFRRFFPRENPRTVCGVDSEVWVRHDCGLGAGGRSEVDQQHPEDAGSGKTAEKGEADW